jgi:hypothetical protein
MFKKIFKFLKKNIGIEEIIIASLSIYLIYSSLKVENYGPPANIMNKWIKAAKRQRKN